jgi:hypothetical protein
MSSTTTKKRGLNVDPVSAAAAAASATDKAAAKKHRKKAVTAKSLGLTKEEFDSIKPTPIKRALSRNLLSR